MSKAAGNKSDLGIFQFEKIQVGWENFHTLNSYHLLVENKTRHKAKNTLNNILLSQRKLHFENIGNVKLCISWEAQIARKKWWEGDKIMQWTLCFTLWKS